MEQLQKAKIQITDLEKHLYNKHLIISRSLQNKPFKIKKDFTDVINTDKHKHLKRIATFFKKHSNVNPNIFFTAPYKLYPDVSYFNLEYFASLRAIKSYTLYKQMLLLESPDNQITDIQKSLRFIAKFCIDNNVYLHRYMHHKTSDIYTWLIHYKENKINIYTVLGFQDVYSLIKSLPEDVKRFYVQDFINKFNEIQSKFINSNIAKTFLLKAIPKVSDFVYKEILQKKSLNNVEI